MCVELVSTTAKGGLNYSWKRLIISGVVVDVAAFGQMLSTTGIRITALTTWLWRMSGSKQHQHQQKVKTLNNKPLGRWLYGASFGRSIQWLHSKPRDGLQLLWPIVNSTWQERKHSKQCHSSVCIFGIQKAIEWKLCSLFGAAFLDLIQLEGWAL